MVHVPFAHLKVKYKWITDIDITQASALYWEWLHNSLQYYFTSQQVLPCQWLLRSTAANIHEHLYSAANLQCLDNSWWSRVAAGSLPEVWWTDPTREHQTTHQRQLQSKLRFMVTTFQTLWNPLTICGTPPHVKWYSIMSVLVSLSMIKTWHRDFIMMTA